MREPQNPRPARDGLPNDVRADARFAAPGRNNQNDAPLARPHGLADPFDGVKLIRPQRLSRPGERLIRHDFPLMAGRSRDANVRGKEPARAPTTPGGEERTPRRLARQ